MSFFFSRVLIDGDDVQANAPLDSALVSEATLSSTNETGEETGVHV